MATGIPVSPPSWTLSHLPSYPFLPGCQRVPALGSPHHMSNSHWLSILHLVIYMFQRYSLKSSHPLLLPLSPKVCSLCLCLLCCPAHRLIFTIFLDFIHIWINIWYLSFSFWLISLCIIGSRFIHLIRTDANDSFIWLNNISQLPYAFICRWASRLLLCPSYCK